MRSGDALIRAGEFHGWRPILYGNAVKASTAGMIGFGGVGRALARMLNGFGCTIVHCDPASGDGVPLSKLLAVSDFVLPLVPLTKQTFHLVDAGTLKQMKRGAYLVNVSRGSIVDEGAVAAALESGHLAGYAADTFEMEDWARGDRPRAISPLLLRQAEKTLFTPHLGSAVISVRLAIERAAALNICEVLAGRTPPDAVNRPG